MKVCSAALNMFSTIRAVHPPPPPPLNKKNMSVCMKGAESARQLLGLQKNF
jgi:hypothetical protein